MKILVAEDEPSVRRSLVRMLNILGYHDIGEAGDGSEALHLIQQSCPEVILADIKMPSIDGLELLARAALISDEIQCIYISGFDYFEYAQKAISLGASGYLLKPVKDTELKLLLDKIEKKLKQNKKICIVPSGIDDKSGMISYSNQETNKTSNTVSDGKEDVRVASRGKATNKQIEKAKEYIFDNYSRDMTQVDVAEFVHLNMSYFSRLFKQETGENFVDYLCNYRLNKAIELLKEGIYKSNEVSHRVGFNNEKYFYKIFKKKTGFTPGEIRNK